MSHYTDANGDTIQSVTLVDTSGNPLSSAGSSASSVNLTKINGVTASVNGGSRDAGTLRVVIATDQPTLASSLNVIGPINAPLGSDGQTNGQWTTGLATLSSTMVYNETNWDRLRGNYSKTADTPGARTGNFQSSTQTNYNARGAYIVAHVSAISGTFTTFQTGIQWSPDGGTTWFGLTPLGANDTAVAAGRTYAWYIYPTNFSQAAGGTPANLAQDTAPTQVNFINAALPRTWRWIENIAGSTPSVTVDFVYVSYIL